MGIRMFCYSNSDRPMRGWFLECKPQGAQQLRSVRCDKAGKLARRLA